MTVVVYTQPNCVQCTQTKRHLDKRGIAYEEREIDAEEIRKAQGAGIMSAPIVHVNGYAAWGGYRPDALDRLAS